MKVVIVEFRDEVEAIFAKYGRQYLRSGEFVFVSLHPAVRVYLKKEGMICRDTIEFLANDAQHRIVLKCEELVQKLVSHIKIRDNYEIEKGYEETLLYHVRLYLNHYLWLIEVLAGIKNKLAVAEIVCPALNKRQGMYSRVPYIQDRERYLGFIAKEFCAKNGIRFTGVPMAVNRENIVYQWLTAIMNAAAKAVALINYKIFVKYCDAGSDFCVVPGLSYRMDLLLQDLRQRHSKLKPIMIWEGKATLKQELNKIYLIFNNILKKWQKKNIIENLFNVELLQSIAKADDLASTENNQFDGYIIELNDQPILEKKKVIDDEIKTEEKYLDEMDKGPFQNKDLSKKELKKER